MGPTNTHVWTGQPGGSWFNQLNWPVTLLIVKYSKDSVTFACMQVFISSLGLSTFYFLHFFVWGVIGFFVCIIRIQNYSKVLVFLDCSSLLWHRSRTTHHLWYYSNLCYLVFLTWLSKEYQHIKRSLPHATVVRRIPEGLTCYARFIACNDHVAFAHTDLHQVLS